MRVRLKELRETMVYDPVEEEAYRCSMSKAGGRAIDPLAAPPPGRIVIVAGFGPVDTGEFYVQIPLEQLPAGAQIGDEFELHFERARSK